MDAARVDRSVRRANHEVDALEVKEHKRRRRTSSDARVQILRSAYQLFSQQGVAQVGVDAIVADSGCAKASLYNNFSSKEELALAFLEERELIWTRGWLEEEVRRRTPDPEQRLLAIFDIFGEWFRKKNFEGCSFINVLLESEFNSPIHRAASRHLANIRSILRGFAIDADLDDCDGFAQSWHILMKGSIVAAYEGSRTAAEDAAKAGRLVLVNWPRLKHAH
ncbi:AcrR family transcriptional regulator [Aminobacter lissarensis]|uniref:AcrR family transcriptional regulator n=1 Tax=Aminobacter carboxidus TaxID=376165 RepID=A0A8E1WL35_9HYPH|nr:TetR/AcrR family transcriptional regulator [Aminobacter lissarensis]MBB6469385.1 AcrR family transcriptional regulator [Aminobacter lissarensis]